MSKKPDGSSEKRKVVSFTRDAADRIAKAVRAHEAGDRDNDPVRSYPRMSGGGGKSLHLGKTTSDWAIDTQVEITLYKYGDFPNETENDPNGVAPIKKVYAINRTKRLVKANRWVIIGSTQKHNPQWYLVEERNAFCDYPDFSLNGEDITKKGYDSGGSTDSVATSSGPVYALMLDGECLKWVAAQEICVVTEVSLTSYGLEFTRSKVWAFVSTGTCEKITIPTISCTTSSG